MSVIYKYLSGLLVCLRKRCIQLTLLLLISAIPPVARLYAQDTLPAVIGGQVLRPDNTPVPFATVTLLHAQDSALVKGTVADINGKYIFMPPAAGRYLISAGLPGSPRSFSREIMWHDTSRFSAELRTVIIRLEPRQLKGVEVAGKRPYIELMADKLVVNPESSISSAGATAMELLQRAPGVLVDSDDNITLKGQSGVMIMIDGKPTNMSAAQVAQLLKGMPGSNIDRIELITNPSAKYDAAGTAGIINLRLKKNENFGTNGSVSLAGAYGRTPKANGAVNLNHRTAQFNLFGFYNYSYQENKQHLLLSRTGTDGGKSTAFDQETNMQNTSNNHTVRVGADYYPGKRHTIGILADIGYRNASYPGVSNTLIGNGKSVDSVLLTDVSGSSVWKRFAYNINYKGILDSAGKELSIDLDYALNKDHRDGGMLALIRDPEDNYLRHGDTTRNVQPADISIRTIKLDYTNPFKNGGRLEAGIKLGFVTSDNRALFDSLRQRIWIFDDNRSNDYVYKENVNAAYLNYKRQIGKFGLQVGVRDEYTHIRAKTHSYRTNRDSITRQDYNDLFPSVFFSYAPGKVHQWALSYTKRLKRPDYDDLNPFEFYLDRYTRQAGNPFLKPAYSHNVELTHTYKQFIVSSLNYSHVKDMITRITQADKDPVTGDSTLTQNKLVNVASADNFNINISVRYGITKWWNCFTNLNGSYRVYETMVNNELLRLSSGGFFGRTQHTFMLPAGLSAELAFFYASPQISAEGLYNRRAMYALDGGIQKQVLKKQGIIKFYVSDVFNMQEFRGTFNTSDRYISLRAKWESRQFKISFNYRFGNQKVKAARTRQPGLESEQSRVKQAGG